MLVGTPRPVNLSVFVALGPALWIGDPGSNPGGATHSGTDSTRPPERGSALSTSLGIHNNSEYGTP